MYDARLARFWSVDPIAYQFPNLSSYQFASNSPLQNIELEGLEGIHSMSQYNKLHATGQLAKEIYSALPANVQQTLVGLANVASATIGIVSSTAYLMGTGGIGAALGATAGFQLSISQGAIGITQIVAGLSNKKIPQGNTVPGLIAYYSGSEYSSVIDAGFSLLPTLLIPKLPSNTLLANSNLFSTISGIDKGLNTLGF